MKKLFLLPLALLSLPAQAENMAGQAANGCSYRIINGQYLTDCSQRDTSRNEAIAAPAQTTNIAANTSTAAVSTQQVESYGVVPMRQGQAPVSNSLAPTAPTAPAVVVLDTRNNAKEVPELDQARTQAELRRLDRDRYYDATYVGVLGASSSFGGPSADKGLGVGLSLGTNLDDFLGIEFSYSYAKQDLSLNLAERSGSAASNSGLRSANDASLSAHLLAGELQFHLTDTYKRLRPYAAAGLAWKSSTLSDAGSSGFSVANSSAPSSLQQSSFGAVAALGTKFRFSETLQLQLAYRYFMPITNSKAKLTSNARANSTATGTRLQLSDDENTSSSLQQVYGGLQYSF